MLSPAQYLQRESEVDTSFISKWKKEEDCIVKSASAEVARVLFAKQQPRRWFPQAEQNIYNLLMARRKRKLKGSTLWIMVLYRRLLQEIYPDDSKAAAFRPFFRPAQRWANSRMVSMRRRSNSKNKSVEERLPQIQRFRRRFRKLLQEPPRHKGHVFSAVRAGVQATQPRDLKYGRFQLKELFNSEQVLLPFVTSQSQT